MRPEATWLILNFSCCVSVWIGVLVHSRLCKKYGKDQELRIAELHRIASSMRKLMSPSDIVQVTFPPEENDERELSGMSVSGSDESAIH